MSAAAAQTIRPKATAAAALSTIRRDTTIRRCDACSGTPRYVQAKLKVGESNAPEEHEAEHASRLVAAGGTYRVTDAGASGGVRRTADEQHPRVTDPGGVGHLRRAMGPAGGTPAPHAASPVEAARAAPARPMAAPVRARLEQGFGASLHGVQVHTGPEAAAGAAAIGARAYAEGNRITLGAGESEHDTKLLAHETTHVLQQRGGGAAPVRRAPPDAPAADDGILSGLDPIALFWRGLEAVAPRTLVDLLHEIASNGLFATLKARLTATLHSVFGSLPDINIEETVAAFRSLLATVRTVVSALAAGDCGPFFAALTQLRDAVSEMADKAWDRITEVLTPVGDYLADLWKKFGAPVVDWLTATAGELWSDIKAIGAKVWDAISSAGATLRDTVWPAIKHFLGFEDSPDTGGGLGEWIAGKADEAWSAIKSVLSPVLAPLQGVVDQVRAVLPLDAIMHLRETVEEWLQHVGDAADSLGEPDKVETEQTTLRGTILPAVLRSVTALKARIGDAGAWVASLIGGLASRVTGFLDGLANNEYLSFAAGLLGFLRTGATTLATWAQETVVGVFESVGNGLVRLSKFIDPILQLLEKLVSVAADLMGKLPDLILGPVWWIIPACIKNPIKDFILHQILSRVPLFQKLSALPDVWAKIEATALRILKQIFVDGDLKGAAWTFFKAILDVLGIPPSLVTGIVSKAAKALNDILHDPVAFLLNMLGALKQGFMQFFDNILQHLLDAIADWMFSQAAEAGIQVPTEFSFQAIASFVLQVLGVSVQKVFERIEKKLGKPAADKLRELYDKAARVASAVAQGVETAFEWIGILQREGPAGIIKHLREKLSDLKDQLLNGAVDWLMDNLVGAAMKKLIKMLDPTGVMAVIESLDAVYSAVETLGAKAKQILMAVDAMLNGVVDIAKGVLGRAAGFVESALAGVVPVLITFLANWMGLEGIGKRIAEIIKTLQGKVEGAIDWLIEKGKGAWDKLTGKDDGKADGGDVRALAGKRLAALVGDNATLENTQKAVPKVLAELQPMGLQRLFLTTAPDGQAKIFAGASPDKEIADLANVADEALNVVVTLRADLSLDGAPIPELAFPANRPGDDPGALGTIPPPSSKSGTYQGQPATFFPPSSVTSPRVGGQSSRTQQGRVGGALVQPVPGSGQVTVLSWNTANNLFSGNNASHAEYHFRDWLITQPREWLARAQGINVHLSHSPCSGCRQETCGNCTGLLCEIVQSILPNVEASRRTLQWDELYEGGRKGDAATGIGDIVALRKCHWNLSGPGGPIATGKVPKGTSKELKRLKLL